MELFCGRVHLRGELGDELTQLFPALRAGNFRFRGPRLGMRGLLAIPAGEQLLGIHIFPGEHIGHVRNPFAQRLRIDPVLAVVGKLLLPAPIRFINSLLHIGGNAISVHMHFPGDVTGRAPDGLDK